MSAGRFGGTMVVLVRRWLVVRAEGLTKPSAATPVPTRPRPSRPRRLLGYAGGTVLALIGAAVLGVLVSFEFGFLGELSSSPPGDPSTAGVIDSGAFWSPDSRLIAFDRSDYGSPDETSAGASDVFVVSSDGSELRRLTRTPNNETVQGWLSNPLRIVYSRYDHLRRPIELYALDLRGGAPVTLGEVGADDQLLALSHDARRALVGSPRLDPKRFALVDLVRDTRRPLPGIADYWPNGAWSRDDSMLAYATSEGIVILRGDRVLRRIPFRMHGMAPGGLAWSPDGRRLVFGEGGDNSSLWLVRIEDGSRSLLAEGGESATNDYPVWSPNGSRIYYRRGSYGDDDGLRAVAPDGSGDTKITDDDWGGGGLFNFEGKGDRWLDSTGISPDGTKVAYLLGERGAWKNWWLAGVMNADGSDKTPFPASLQGL